MKYLKEVFHLYHINVENLKTRNQLQKFLIKNNIDAKYITYTCSPSKSCKVFKI